MSDEGGLQEEVFGHASGSEVFGEDEWGDDDVNKYNMDNMTNDSNEHDNDHNGNGRGDDSFSDDPDSSFDLVAHVEEEASVTHPGAGDDDDPVVNGEADNNPSWSILTAGGGLSGGADMRDSPPGSPGPTTVPSAGPRSDSFPIPVPVSAPVSAPKPSAMTSAQKLRRSPRVAAAAKKAAASNSPSAVAVKQITAKVNKGNGNKVSSIPSAKKGAGSATAPKNSSGVTPYSSRRAHRQSSGFGFTPASVRLSGGGNGSSDDPNASFR